MDNKMAVFNNCEFGSIRVIEQNGKYLFCGSDVQRPWGIAIPARQSGIIRGGNEMFHPHHKRRPDDGIYPGG